MRWNYMSKPLRFLLIMAEHQDCPFFTAFITIKPSSQNISIVLLQISPKLNERWGGYWRKRLPWMILEEQFPVLRNTAKSKKVKAAFRCYDNSNVIATLIITNFHLYLIQLCWQFFQIFVYGNLVYAKTWGYFPWKTVSSHLNILRVTAWEGRFIEIWLWLTCLQRKDYLVNKVRPLFINILFYKNIYLPWSLFLKSPGIFWTWNQIFKSKSKEYKCRSLQLNQSILFCYHANCKNIRTCILNVNNNSSPGPLIIEFRW